MAHSSSDYEYDDYGIDMQLDTKLATREGETAAAVAAALRLSGEAGDSARKRRRPLPKLDVERLMGERGFRHLRQQLAPSKFAFTDHTEADLGRIVRVYKEWADFMFPKMPFRDVCRRIQRLSKQDRSLRTYVKALKEAVEEGREFDEVAFVTGLALDEASGATGQLIDN